MLTGRKKTVFQARRLRRGLSLPEGLLWRALRKRPRGLKFRRQHPAGIYILDFFCASARLAIEVDGASHDFGNRPEQDIRRDAWLESEGVLVLRIPARAVIADLEAAVAHILEAAMTRQPLHQPTAGPPPRTGEE